MSDWTQSLRQASWRGVPFGVLSSTARFGRRQALHEYPYRDTPWVEDLGRGARKITLSGFLVANSIVYGGGDVIAQRARIIGAAEAQGSGTLIHPSLGQLTVNVSEIAITEHWDGGQYFELEFSFIESGAATFPVNPAAPGAAVLSSATNADTAAGQDFATALTPLLPAGGAAVRNLVASAVSVGSECVRLAADATSLLRQVSQLSGDFGRFFHGASLGAFVTTAGVSASVQTLIASGAAARAALAAAAAQETTLAGQIGLAGALPTDLAASAQASVAALLAAVTDPADGLRLLGALATYDDGNVVAISRAFGDMHRRAAVVALARASQTYQPASYDDANAVRQTVVNALDVEIDLAGDAAQDATFIALRTLRASVVQDLTARGATLQPMIRIASPEPMPSLVLANRLYRDAARFVELEFEADPIHPLFMPTSFRALAA